MYQCFHFYKIIANAEMKPKYTGGYEYKLPKTKNKRKIVCLDNNSTAQNEFQKINTKNVLNTISYRNGRSRFEHISIHL